MSNQYTRTEIKFLQKNIRSFNTYLQNIQASNGMSQSGLALVDDLIGISRMTDKGYAKYSAKYLESLSRKELEVYIEDIQKAMDIINLFRSEGEIKDLLENGIPLSNPVSTFWNLFSMLKAKGVELDSDQVKEITDRAEEGELSTQEMKEHVENFQKAIADPEGYGISDWAERYTEIDTLSKY